MSARDEVLARVRSALGPGVAVPDVPRRYRGPRVDDSSVDRFCERVAEYKATVTRISAYELADTVARLGRGPLVKAALPGWTAMRELPDPPKQTFREWWRERSG